MKTEHLDNRINELETLKSRGDLSNIGSEMLIEFKAIKKALIIDNVVSSAKTCDCGSGQTNFHKKIGCRECC